MSGFHQFFLMKPDDARRYVAEVLRRFEPGKEADCVEIGDGNINYVFRVWSKRDKHSIIVKQADKLLRFSGHSPGRLPEQNRRGDPVAGAGAFEDGHVPHQKPETPFGVRDITQAFRLILA